MGSSEVKGTLNPRRTTEKARPLLLQSRGSILGPFIYVRSKIEPRRLHAGGNDDCDSDLWLARRPRHPEFLQIACTREKNRLYQEPAADRWGQGTMGAGVQDAL